MRLIGRLCPSCSRRIPDDLAKKLTLLGLPAAIDGNTIRASILDHEIQLGFSPSQGTIYYQPARQAERRLFQGLEADLKCWSHERGLSFATKEGVD
jgi:hypothetical protein